MPHDRRRRSKEEVRQLPRWTDGRGAGQGAGAVAKLEVEGKESARRIVQSTFRAFHQLRAFDDDA